MAIPGIPGPVPQTADVVRFALFEEGGDAFAVVVRAEQLTEAGAHPAPELGPVGIERLSEAVLQPLNGKRWVGRDGVGQLERLRQQCVVGDDRDTSRTRRASSASMRRPVKSRSAATSGRRAAPDGQDPRRRSAAALHEQLAEPGALGYDADVGHQRQFHPPPDGGAVDGCDHGHVRLEQRTRGGREPGAAASRAAVSEPAATMICLTSSPEQNAGSAPVMTRHRAVVDSTARRSSS